MVSANHLIKHYNQSIQSKLQPKYQSINQSTLQPIKATT